MKDQTIEQKATLWDKFKASFLSVAKLDEGQAVKLTEYVAKDGSKIEVDEATGEVQGDVKDGEYELEDGSILVVTSGKAEIKAAPAPEAAAADAPTDAPADSTTVDPAKLVAEIDALKAENEQLKAEIESLKGESATLKESNTDLATKLSAAKAKPAEKAVAMNAKSQPTDSSYGQSLKAAFGIK